jgi:hypothetical protein
MVLAEMVYGVCHQTEPTSFRDALSEPDSKEWMEAIKQNLLLHRRTAILIEWVFKRKTNAKGKVCVYNTRLVYKDSMQRKGRRFVETFARLAKFPSLACFIEIAAYSGFQLEQMDVVTVFLNPDV